MSILSNLKGREELWSPAEGINISIKSLTVEEGLKFMSLIDDETSQEKRAEGINQLIYNTLKKSIPDATDEEINTMGIEHLTSLMDVIKKVNNMESEEASKVDKIKDIQQRFREQRKKK